MAEIRKRITAILSRMKHDTLERDKALTLSLLSVLAGESIFLLGLLGVGKSMIARQLKLEIAKSLSYISESYMATKHFIFYGEGLP